MKTEVTYKIIERKDEEYRYNIQIWVDGCYCGNGRFCKTLEEAEEFIRRDKESRIK